MKGIGWSLCLLATFCLNLINGQGLFPHELCSSFTAGVNSFSSGTINHYQKPNGNPCILILSGFTSRSYVSIPRVGVASDNACDWIIINGNNYCVKSSELGESIIIQLTDTTLNVTLPDPTVSTFILNYYGNVAACGDDITIPEGPQANQLSGVISSSYDPTQLTELTRCTVYISNIPGQPATLKFTLLYSSGTTDPISITPEIFSQSDSDGSTILVTSNSPSVILGYSPLKSAPLSFIINFEVIYCKAEPVVQLDNGEISVPAGPNFPGARTTFHCNHGWYIAEDTKYIECQVVDGVGEWSDASGIKCSRVTWCLTSPADVGGATFEYTSNTTAVYRCIEGYETDNTESERTIRCNPPVEAGNPWTWSPAEIVCKFVVRWCLTSPAKIEKATFTYTSNTTAVYRCIEGYTTDNSNSERTIRCNPPVEAGNPWTWSRAKIVCYNPNEGGKSERPNKTTTQPRNNAFKEQIQIIALICASGVVGLAIVTIAALKLCKMYAVPSAPPPFPKPAFVPSTNRPPEGPQYAEIKARQPSLLNQGLNYEDLYSLYDFSPDVPPKVVYNSANYE